MLEDHDLTTFSPGQLARYARLPVVKVFPYRHPGFWLFHNGTALPCDSDGWIAHEPTSVSDSPVPQGVRFEIKRRDGTTDPGHSVVSATWLCGYYPLWQPHHADAVAWRPV